MSSPASTSLYSIDTSTFMEWHDRYYPPDLFPGMVSRFDSLVQQGRLAIAELVREEADVMGPATLQTWIKDNKAIIRPTADHLAGALEILGRFPGLKDPKARHDEADAYVISVAQQLGPDAIVVTQETEAALKSHPKRIYIPDVCRSLGITCVNLLGLMRREGWTL